MEQKVKIFLEEELHNQKLTLIDWLWQDGKIVAEIDGMQNVSIAQCVEFTKLLRKEFEEALAAFEITISSPGLDKPFRHPLQYQKNIGKTVTVQNSEGQKFEGQLLAASENQITLDILTKPKHKNVKPAPSGAIKKIDVKTIQYTKKRIVF